MTALAAVEVDHVLMPVADLDGGGRWLLERYGLHSVAGGSHPGVGTVNRIVPLGATYLELIAAADGAEAAGNPRGRRVMAAARQGLTFATWAVRCPDIGQFREHALRRGLGVGEIVDGSRLTPAGTTLRWRSMELSAIPGGVEPGLLPFAIEWAGPPDLHPSRVAAGPQPAADIAGLVFQDPDPERWLDLLADVAGAGCTVAVEPGPASRLVGVDLAAGAGTLSIR